MAWIRTVGAEEAEGKVREVYESIRAAFGRPSPAFTVMSLDPPYLRGMWELHSAIMAEGELKRVEKEAVALAVSTLNRCAYCTWAHSGRLKNLGMDPDVVRALVEDPSGTPVEGRLGAILRWVLKATRDPAGMAEGDLAALRKWGLEDEAILEAAAVMGHFNHLNRVLDALGVQPPRP